VIGGAESRPASCPATPEQVQADVAAGIAPVPAEIAGRIAVGVAGWSYPDWDGFVYPAATRDRLRFVAGCVDMVEINTTFYRPPEAATVASWERRTRDIPGFFFTAKLSREVTHNGRMDAEIVYAFHAGLEPLTSAGRLRHLLAQFKWDFGDTPERRRYLEELRRQFGDVANLTLELRHRSWESAEAMTFLSDLGVTVANLDYPQSADSFGMRLCGVGRDAYLRLHGRNSKAWFSKDAGRDETYNYCYDGREIEDIVARSVQLAGMSRSLTVVANNHYQGKEMLNALEIKARVAGGKVFVPPDLAERYPRVKRIQRPTPGRPVQPPLPL
jgi:uncharacterized protein YecE (DUF72 family)